MTLYASNRLYLQTPKNEERMIEPSIDQLIPFTGLRKLSLFKKESRSADLNNAEKKFISLLSSIEEPVYFTKKIVDGLLLWEVITDSNTINFWLKQRVETSDFDFILWPNKYFESPKLLVFDMDSTFIQIEVIDELARRHGVGDSVSKVTEAAMRGELDFAESLVSRVACLHGLDSSTIEDVANNLPLSEGVEKLVKQSRKHQVKTTIVSGGFTPFVSHLKNELDLFEVKANDLEVVDGVLSGKVLGNIVDAEAKARFVNELKDKLRIHKNEILTIGDGANDLLMMQESGFNLAYRAKPTVQQQAKGRMNWTFLNHLISVFNW